MTPTTTNKFKKLLQWERSFEKFHKIKRHIRVKHTPKEKIPYSPEPKPLVVKSIILLFLVIVSIKILVILVFLPWVANVLRHTYDIGHNPDFYANIASNLSQGIGYRVFPDTTVTMLREPGYIVILAGIYHFFGEGYFVPRIFNIAFSLITAFFLYKIGEEVCMPPNARILALLLFLLHPAFFFVESRLGVEGLFTLLLVMTSYSMLVAQRKQTILSFMLCGVCSALTALTRTAVVPFLMAWVAYIIVSRRHAIPVRVKAKTIVAYALAFLLLFSIWPLRNYLLSGKLVLTANSSGDSLFQGMYANKHRSSEKPNFRVLADSTKEQLRLLRSAGLQPQYSGFFYLYATVKDELRHCNLMKKAAIEEYTKNPSLFLYSVAHNSISFWTQGGTKVSTILNTILIVPILIMTISGIFLQIRRGHYVAPILLPVLLIYIVHLPIITLARYHVPTIPFLMLFCGVFLSWLLKKDLNGTTPHHIGR